MSRGFRVWDNQTKSYEVDREFVLSSSGGLMELCSNHDGTWEYHFADTNRFIIEFETGLADKNADMICEGDIIRFDDDNGIWQAPVVFERGLFGLDVYHPKQIKNPEDWDKEYDKVDTRWWSTVWGYGEAGTAFTYRTPLAKATIFKGSPEEYEKSEQKELYEKFGYGNYYVMAEVVGNIHEPLKDFRPEHLKRMGVSISKGSEE